MARTRRLDSIHTALPPNHGVVVLTNLSVIAKNADSPIQFAVVSHDRAGFTKCTEVFAWIEAEASGITEGPCPPSLVFGSMSLAGILNYKEAVPSRKFQDWIHV